MDFGEVLSKAWQITWKYKILWLFGILAGCGGQIGNNSFNYSMGGDGGGSPSGPSDMPNLPPGLQQFFFSIERWIEQLSEFEIIIFIVAAFVLSLILVAFFTILGTVGRIGLVKGTMEGDRGAVSLSMGELMQGVRPYFWRVIGLGLLLALAFLIVGLILGGFIALTTIFTFGLGLICLAPILCLLVPVGWFIGLIVQQAYVALIVEDLSITAALSRGWEVTRQNPGPVILMGLILNIGVILIGGSIIALPFTLIALPALGGLALGSEQALRGGLLIAGLCFVAYLPMMILLGGVIRSYYESAWTLTYLRLTKPPQQISMEAE